MDGLRPGIDPSGGALPDEATAQSALAGLDRSLKDRSGGRLALETSAGVPLLLARLPAKLRVGFTTRLGGVSNLPYASLNLSAKTGDEAGAVGQNLARLRRAIERVDGEAERTARESAIALISPSQVHGTRVVGAAEHREQGAEADGLVVHPDLDRGTAALLLFADCVPVVLVGEVDTAVVHAGWRGLLEGVIQQGARAMTGPPALAFVGPSIGPCCYEVGEDLRERFAERYGGGAVKGDRLDLWSATGAALSEIGVSQGQVINPRLCTACQTELFYSHRREGPRTGRQGALAWWSGT